MGVLTVFLDQSRLLFSFGQFLCPLIGIDIFKIVVQFLIDK